MDPILAEVAVERPDIVFGKVNVAEEPNLAHKYGIRLRLLSSLESIESED